ncbi:MAG: diphosphomevalonate decarboxylase [Chitinophagales bacterium]|nr:diphosphomevalonate decarboxylase [Chitinophagales bacterium]
MGKIIWRSPSNIALIKYWGKYGHQLPKNASISFTLENAFTETGIAYIPKDTPEVSISFLFEGQTNELFENKIKKFLESIVSEFPFLQQYHLDIDSYNSFPHSTGIASSASSMSALALCLCSIERHLEGKGEADADFFAKASRIARMGSGSASRSVYPTLAAWGSHPSIPQSSQEYAVSFEHAHPVFATFKDAILIVSKNEKEVSSRVGHALMEENPFAEVRFRQAATNMDTLISTLHNGDLNTFGSIVEKEALTLHALMMTSEPSFILMKPATLNIIEAIRGFRNEHQIPVFFTLDAGPNVHILYPEAVAEKVENFIEEKLLKHCEKGQWISDRVGSGPKRV